MIDLANKYQFYFNQSAWGTNSQQAVTFGFLRLTFMLVDTLTSREIIVMIGSALATGATAVWAWYTTKISPARIAKEADAFRQVLENNKMLINTNVSNYNTLVVAIEKLEKTIKDLEVPRHIADTRTQLTISNLDRVAVDKLLSEIRALLAELKTRQEMILSQIVSIQKQ